MRFGATATFQSAATRGGVQRRCVSATAWEQGKAKLCAAMSLPVASHAASPSMGGGNRVISAPSLKKTKNYNQTTPLQNNLLIFAAENKTIKSDYDDAMNDCDWYQTTDEH